MKIIANKIRNGSMKAIKQKTLKNFNFRISTKKIVALKALVVSRTNYDWHFSDKIYPI